MTATTFSRYPWFLCLWLLAAATPTAAQEISEEQIRQLQNLPRAQQEALARQQGFDLDKLSPQGTQQQERPREVQVVQTPLSDPESPDSERRDQDDDGLKPFGYDLFAGRPTTFAPVTEIPLPSDYVVGPGDVIRLQLYGKENDLLELPVTRDGVIQMTDSGPIPVAGMNFETVRKQLKRQVEQKYIGTQVSVSLGELRSMRVFVLGEARNPGSYTVSSLSTMTNALLVSGGIKTSGSLRNVQLKRDGQVIGSLDLYQLLLSGDTSSDQRLQPGDTLFIPPVGETVAVDGEVRRPAIYELKGGETLADMIAMAGHYTRDAAPAFSQLERVKDERRRRALESVDLTRSEAQGKPVREGDKVTVKSLNDLTEGFVQLRGQAKRPGKREFRPGMRLSDLLKDRHQDLPGDADLNYALVVRETNDQGEIAVRQFRPAGVFRDEGGDSDLVLKERDQILLFSRQTSEEQDESRKAGRGLLDEVLEKLERQASPDKPAMAATIGGAVRFPGRYPLSEQATVRDLIDAGGGLRDSALMLEAELVRSQVSGLGQAETELITFPLVQGVENGADEVALQGYDRLLIKGVPGFAKRETITLEGEVRFPGQYSIRIGDTLKDVIERAGGLTERAFPEGAIFSRERLRRQEQERMEMAEQRLRRDLLGLQLEAGEQGPDQDLGMLQNLLQQVQQVEAMGRLVIDLEALVAGRLPELEVLDGDRLQIPRRPQSVSVFGEVQFASSHLYDPDLAVTDYLDRSGGFSAQADEERIYVIRADGSVWRPSESRWFSGRGETLRPGDTIVAPIKLDRVNQLQLATNISQVFSNLAVSAAALNSF
ncbi:MAG: SLBB domain-containing protein [Oleiphilaceae bacterium]|nr:SLBB domain-containing protein [Oleiphilaceae bacterium]